MQNSEYLKRKGWESLPWLKNSTFTDEMVVEAISREALLIPRNTIPAGKKKEDEKETDVIDLSDSEVGESVVPVADHGEWKEDSYPILLCSLLLLCDLINKGLL
jgi:hypothetical protein